jgi:predicted SnoaL-like aldol condensation-catalyzing enzyme
VSRKLKSREYAEKMPGAPDGRYVVVQYFIR